MIYQNLGADFHMPKSGYRSEKGPVFSLAWFHTRLLVSLAISQSLCLSVYNFSQKRLVRFCWFFSIMLEVSNRQKLTKSDFLGKFYLAMYFPKGVKNCPLRGFILFFDKSYHLIFLEIVKNERRYCYLFWNSNMLSGKILALELQPKILLYNHIGWYF